MSTRSIQMSLPFSSFSFFVSIIFIIIIFNNNNIFKFIYQNKNNRCNLYYFLYQHIKKYFDFIFMGINKLKNQLLKIIHTSVFLQVPENNKNKVEMS